MQASISKLYGKVQEVPQNETTFFYPRLPYAALDKKLDTRFDELSEKIENNSFKIDTLN